MDKFLKAIELAEHPEKFSGSELASLLEDPEIREIYDTICQVDSAFISPKSLSQNEVNNEWARFSVNENISGKKSWLRIGVRRSVAAVVAVVAVVASVSALAFGIGLMSRYLSENTSKHQIQHAEKIANTDVIAKETDIIPSDSTGRVATSVIFENETLGNVLKEISQHYGLTFEVVNDDAMNIRLYYKWNAADEATEVVRQLNSFDRIRLTLEDDILILK